MLTYTDFELNYIKSLNDLKKDKKEVVENGCAMYNATSKADCYCIGGIYKNDLCVCFIPHLKAEFLRLTVEGKGRTKAKNQYRKKAIC